MNKKYLLVSMNDERIKEIAEIFGNRTCKKILDYLSNNEQASEKDMADSLKVPINTIEYNLKKLLKTDLVESTSNFFWSKKGKKIVMYRLSNKSVIISPKNFKISSKVKSILPVALISVALAILVRTFYSIKESVNEAGPLLMKAGEGATDLAASAPERFAENSSFLFSSSPAWVWFLGGALLAIVIFAVLNWRKL
jgi:DNA-binding transcriptional ArsR family regulator